MNNSNPSIEHNVNKIETIHFGWRFIGKASICLTLVVEAIKTTALTIKMGYDPSNLLLGIGASFALALAYFLMGICIEKNSSMKTIIFREFAILASMLIFLFSLQSNFMSIESSNSGQNIDFFSTITNLTSIFGLLLAFFFAQNLLKMSIYSKVIMIIYFFVYMFFYAMARPELRTISTYINILVPLIYILILMYIHRKLLPEKEINNNHNHNLSGLSSESIFFYGENNKTVSLNGFLIKDIADKYVHNPIEIFQQIYDMTLIDEEICSEKEIDTPDYNDEYFTRILLSGDIESPHSKNNPKNIAININNNLSPNLKSRLDIIAKSLLAKTKASKKDVPKKKTYTYFGKIHNKFDELYHLEIKIHIFATGKYPLVIIIKDNIVGLKLKEFIERQQNREEILSNLVNDVNKAVELSKLILEDSLNSLKQNTSFERTKLIFLNSIKQIITPLVMTIGDILDFYSSRNSRLIYEYGNFDIEKIITETIKLFELEAKSKSIKLIFDISKDLQNCCKLNTDRKRLIQLLTRLISNSLKYVTQGTIKIILKPLEYTYLVSVEDDGVGLSPHILEKTIKDLQNYNSSSLTFLHSKVDNTQGLAIAQMLALGLGPKEHGGLMIKSEFNKGTTISFILENKSMSVCTTPKNDTTANLSPKNYQKSAFSPTRASKFKAYQDCNSLDVSVIFKDINESVEIQSPVHKKPETEVAQKTHEKKTKNTLAVTPQVIERENKNKDLVQNLNILQEEIE